MEIVVEHLLDTIPIECCVEDGSPPTLSQIKRTVAAAVDLPEENFHLETAAGDLLDDDDVEALCSGDLLRTTPSERGEALITLAKMGLNTTPQRSETFPVVCEKNEKVALLYILAGYAPDSAVKGVDGVREPLWYALHSAVLVEALLKRGANVNVEEGYLLRAVMRRDVEVAQLLLKHGATAKGLCKNGIPVLQHAARIHGASSLCSNLIDINAEINCRVSATFGSSPLLAAVTAGNLDVCRLLLSRGADPNLYLTDAPPICVAIRMKYKEITELLLAQKETDIFLPDSTARSVLSHAAEKDADLCINLLETGRALSEVNRTDNEGQPPLYHATRSGALDAVKCLLQHNADPNLCGDATTCLMQAGALGRVDIMKLLVEAGAEVCAVHIPSSFPVLGFVAWRGGSDEAVEYLIQNGAGAVSMKRTLRLLSEGKRPMVHRRLAEKLSEAGIPENDEKQKKGRRRRRRRRRRRINKKTRLAADSRSDGAGDGGNL